MNKMIMNRLTMLAVTLMASMACFAQGKSGETTGWGFVFGPNYQELSYSVTTISIHQAVVTGFASYVVATPKIMDDPEAYSNDPNLQIKKNTIIINHFMTGSPSVWIPSVADNAFASVASDLASKIKTIKIDFKPNSESSNTTQNTPVKIGENAFAGLTSVDTVFSYTPGEYVTNEDIKESAFAPTVYSNASLIVPDCSMGKYAKAQGWKNFVSIYNTAGELFGDINGDGDVTGADLTALKKVIAGTRDETDACDVNCDDDVTGADLTALKRVIAGTY